MGKAGFLHKSGFGRHGASRGEIWDSRVCGKKFKKERFFPVAFAASFGHIAAVAATSRGERV